MNIYFVIIVIVSLLILAGSVRNGYRRGFSDELRSLFRIAAMVLVVLLVGGIVSGRQAKDAESVLMGFIGLVLLALAFKVLNFLLGGLHLVTRLPLLKSADAVLGAVLGFCEGFIILYLLEYLLRLFLGGRMV